MLCKIWFKGVCLDVPENWMKKHPGGDKVFKIFHNRDATDVILAAHSLQAQELAQKMVASSKSKENKHLYDEKENIGLVEELPLSDIVKKNKSIMDDFEDTDYMKLFKIAR